MSIRCGINKNSVASWKSAKKMFVYFYLTAELIEENLRMWTAGEEMSEYRFHLGWRYLTASG